MKLENAVAPTALSDEQVARLNAQRIFFGHQSVGDNIMDGIRDLMAENSRIRLNIVKSDSPESAAVGPAFVECHIGHNRIPETKNLAFAEILNRGQGLQGGIALFKYCYIDFNSRTDVSKVFAAYSKQISELHSKYPALKLVHVTVPLTVEQPTKTPKAWLRANLKRVFGRDENVKRNQFNELLRKAYAGSSRIFDLAEGESTLPDGSRSFFRRGTEKIYTLTPEFTTDGGHLNHRGRRVIAERLLLLLASL